MRRQYHRKKKKSKLKKILLSLLGIIIISMVGYGYYLYMSVAETASSMHDPLDRETSEKRTEEVSIKKKQPVSFLLMGVDEREGDKGRADTLIVITVNPNQNSMKMFNIPRDTRTMLVGYGTEDKINHSYAFGGTEMTVKSVEHFLDIPIDFYIKVNMEALSDIVDALGGVTVTNTLDWYDDERDYHYKKGNITLLGNEALGYVRMRYQDPRGDLGRNERQRQLIQAIIDQGASFSSFAKIDDILNALGENVKTNLTFDEMKTIQSQYASARSNMETFEITGKGTTINGIYYLAVPDNEKSAISAKVKEHLEIK